MSQITTHILDTGSGRPAAGVNVHLFFEADQDWQQIAEQATNSDGRVSDWLAAGETLPEGNYRITFDTGSYFRQQGVSTFYPHVDVVFHVTGDGQHYHVPLLVSPFGYSTYRGS